jgi:RimJ/RimL family protein N-acetyltransferase
MLLRFFEPSDIPQLINWINTEELLLNWSGRMFTFPLTQESMDWYVRETNEIASSDAFIFKAVEGNEVLGHISLGGISTVNKSARISRVFVSEAGRSKGVCTFMVKEVLKFGFKQLHLHRITLGVYTSNVPALACYTKAGLNVEGINRDVLLVNGTYWSMTEMAILHEEWISLQKKNQ